MREGFAKSLYKYYMEDYVGSGDTLGNAFTDLQFKEISFEEFVETIRRTIDSYRIVQVKPA